MSIHSRDTPINVCITIVYVYIVIPHKEQSCILIILSMYVGEYIVNIWKIFLDRLSRFDDAVFNVTVRTYQ